MFKIRNSCFETNSSSMDRFTDYERNNTNYAVGIQNIYIDINWADNLSDNRYSEICDMIENGKLGDKLCDIMFKIMESENICLEDIKNIEISADFIKISMSFKTKIYVDYDEIAIRGYSYISEVEFSDKDNFFPEKQDIWKNKEKYINEILKLFKDENITEIVEISDIYGDDNYSNYDIE